MKKTGKYFFISDAHLGVPDYESSLTREKKIVLWLDSIKNEAEGIFLMGDIFDFWFEYKDVVPKYFVRFLGKIAELTDAGIPVWFFAGNHDMWTFEYLQKETGVKVCHKPESMILHGKKFFLAHGDGLGPNDKGYKFIKAVFRNKICIKLFSCLHPRIGFTLANSSSKKSRNLTRNINKAFKGEKGESLIAFANEILAKEHYNYFIFGHRHLAIKINIGENTTFVNLGDWMKKFTYAEFDGDDLAIKTFDNSDN